MVKLKIVVQKLKKATFYNSFGFGISSNLKCVSKKLHQFCVQRMPKTGFYMLFTFQVLPPLLAYPLHGLDQFDSHHQILSRTRQ
jgi:hypothetical protein